MISDSEKSISATKRRRKLTIQDAEAIAKLIVKQKCTEHDACLALDIKPEAWRCWKSRHKHSATFDALITRIREVKLSGFIDRIESAGDDFEIELPNGKIINKRGDWRALAWLADKEKRFQAETSATAPQVTLQIGIIHEHLKRVINFDDIKAINDNKKLNATTPDAI